MNNSLNTSKLFSTEVIENLGNYVYRLIDPRNGETFYVGKGVENRVFAHINDEEDEYKKSLSKDEKEENISFVSQKFKRIREILSSGEEVIHVIHRHGLSSDEAFLVEATLIDAFPGLANIQGGAGRSDFGPMSVKQIQNLYTKEEAEFTEKVILIAINKLWKEDNSHDELYDVTRFAWRLALNNAKKAEFVVAHANGIIREVYEPKEWLEATYENFPEIIHMKKIGAKPEDYPNDRLAFKGKRAEKNIRDKYKGKRVPAEYRKRGAANPIKYTFLAR